MFFFDLPYGNYQYFFQDPASPVMEGIINFHHDLLSIQLFIGFFVLWFLIRIIFSCQIEVFSYTSADITHVQVTDTISKMKFLPTKGPVHNTLLEVIWTVIPALILIYIAVPSFALLYSMDELTYPEQTVKIVGNQWYWVYEARFQSSEVPEVGSISSLADAAMSVVSSSPFKIVLFESRLNLNLDSTLSKGWPYEYLLSVDNFLNLPARIPVRLLMTSNDVLHSWTVPSFGVKLDACPGRLNQTGVFLDRFGLFYGQCSEICGVNHAFMPITVRVVSPYMDFYRNYSDSVLATRAL